MRIAIVGDRHFSDAIFVESVLSQFCEDNRLDIYSDISIVSGGASGVDTSARDIANILSLPFEEFLPKSYHKWAFLDRNKLIVDNSDHVLAFLTCDSKGTRHTINYAVEKNKPVTVVDVKLSRVLDGFTLGEDMKLEYTSDDYGPMYSLFKVPMLEGLSSSQVKKAICGKSKEIVYDYNSYLVFIETAKRAIADVVSKYRINVILQISGSSPLMGALMDELVSSLDVIVYPASWHGEVWNFMRPGDVPAHELHNNNNVLIIEDVITEGSTLHDAMRAVKDVSESATVVGLSIWK